MTGLPAHVVETTETTTKYRCQACGSRLILGTYLEPARAEQVLAEWLARHKHDQPAPPTEREPS